MSAIKRGQDNQILFTVYTKSTGVQNSGATASQISSARTLYGVVHGGNTAAVSKSISRAPSLVRSGLFRLSVKNAEVSNFDEVLIHIEGNTSLILPFNGLFSVETVDDSDLYSALTLIQSMASDAASAAQQGNSRALVTQSMASDTYSAVILTQSMASDAASAAQQANSRVLLTQSMASDAASAAAQANSRALVIQSLVSDVDSALTSRFSDTLSVLAVIQSMASDAASAAAQANSRVLVTQSMASDTYSAVILTQSLVSDVDSALTSRFSDLLSLLNTTGIFLNASAISDVGSQVWANTIGARVDSRLLLTQSMASDAASAAQQANSRALVVQSMASDAASAATQANSRAILIQSMVSDVDSAITSRFSDTLSVLAVIQSMASDAHSAAAQANSRALVTQSMASDAASAAAQANSRALIVQSMASDTLSAVTLMASNVSDAMSAAQQANSRVLLNQSRISDVYSLLSDYVSDFGSRIPAALATITAVPGNTPSLQAAIMFLFHAQKYSTTRNASLVTIGNSAGAQMTSATVSWNAATSVFTRGTFVG